MKLMAIILASIILATTVAEPYQESAAEKKIYSYVQAPREHYKDKRWIGDWSEIEAGGQKFSRFGCGICCVANAYSTFKHAAITPDIVYWWAREYSSYNPDKGVGAISWKQMQDVLSVGGFKTSIHQKPDDYKIFQEHVKNADTTIVVVCKYNDGKLWWYTRGHYVNLWNYDKSTDTVFITDPSGLFNRSRVQLKDIYDALKTKNDAQYMVVNYEE